PPILMYDSATRNVRELEENGLFLSWMADASYSSKEVALGLGDWIVLYSDGITEMQAPNGEEFGKDRLRGFIEAHSALSPEEFATQLLETTQTWSGRSRDEEPDDDVTLVVAHVKDL